MDCRVAALRAHGILEFMLDVNALARRHALPVYDSNSQFEVNVHVAATFSCVAQFVLSDLAWNRAVGTTVQFANGLGYAPDRPGYGLELIDLGNS